MESEHFILKQIRVFIAGLCNWSDFLGGRSTDKAAEVERKRKDAEGKHDSKGSQR
jgi:hypothetical protein